MQTDLDEDRARRILEAAAEIQDEEEQDLGATQKELVMRTGISRPTIKKYCDALVDHGVLMLTEKSILKLYYPAVDPQSDDWWPLEE